MSKKIRKVAKINLGGTRDLGSRDTEFWCWNENVKVMVKNKCFKILHRCNSTEN